MTMQATRRDGWPGWLAIEDGTLTADGCRLPDLAARYGTPLWVISRERLEDNFARFRAAFRRRRPDTEVAYSMKANSTLAVVRVLNGAGARIDCSSEHEIALARRAGVPGGDIVVNGNGKSDGTLRACADEGVLQVNIDSEMEAERLDAIAAERGVVVDCAVRIQLSYDRLLAEDPSFESTLTVGEGKFGNNVSSGDAMSTVAAVVAAPNLHFVGLHHHVGFSGYMGDYTPEREVMHHRECTREICDLAKTIMRELDVVCERFDLGGGFRGGESVYLASPGDGEDGGFHPLPAIDDYVEAIVSTIEEELPRERNPRLMFETGGYQVADAALFLTTVAEVKRKHGPKARDFVTVDGSMQMFTSKGTMRVASEVVVANRVPTEGVRGGGLADVVGQTCVYDALAEAIELGPVEVGDRLCLLGHGAYCDTTGTQMNSFPRPASVMISSGEPVLVRRRETLDDVAARDLIPDLGGGSG